MVGTVYFKDGRTETIISETFVRSGTENLFFVTENEKQYHVKVVAEIVDTDKNEWAIGSKLLFFKRCRDDHMWMFTDEIEKIGIKMEERE